MKRIHEYSRSSRFRIRRLLRNAANNVAINDTSSSDSDGEVMPVVRPNIARNLNVAADDAGTLSGDSSTSATSNHSDPSVRSASDMDVGDAQGILNNEPEDSFEHSSSQQSEENESSDDIAGVEDNDNAAAAEGVDSGSEGEGVDSGSEGEGGHNVEYDGDWDHDDNVLIYEMASITLGESMLAILSFYLRHNLSLACLADLLALIDLHCRQENNRFTKSLYQFKKYFANVPFPIVKHYYCSTCYQRVPNRAAACQYNHGNKNDFFIQTSVIPQLQALYKRPQFREKLNYRFNRRKFAVNNYEDLYDGAVYRELSQNGNILSNPLNISLMFYTDGVSIFKSSKNEIWPFYFVINELSYNERTKISNALLGGLWFGKSKPAPAIFLQPIREDLLMLRQGINISYGYNPVRNITVKGIVMCGTADIPAKAKFLNFKAHNSTYGCAKCIIRSENIRRGLNVYPFRDNIELRTEQNTTVYAQEAMTLPMQNGIRRDVFGVKGPTLLSGFVYKWVRTMAVDEMHCVYNGVMKSLLNLWFDSKYRENDYSLSAHKELVCSRLSAISPPGFVQRLTRTLHEVKYWKAHEMKSFLFYYSLPVLSDLLPELYVNHHKLLVLGVYLLNQRSISDHQVNIASQMLTEYVLQFQDLYGIENMSCNLHQLLHLSDVVRDLGPLWVTSCFPFENMNGKLKKLVKGTRYAEMQVCSGISMLVKLAELINRIPDDGRAAGFVKNLFDANREVKRTIIGHKMAIIGKYFKINALPQFVEGALEYCNIDGRNCYEFYRLLKYCTIYGSTMYRRAVKSNSTSIKFRHRGEVCFGFINRFLRISDCACRDFCANCNARYYAIAQKCDTLLIYRTFEGTELNFVHEIVDREGEYVAVDVKNDLLCLCFVVNIPDRNATYLVEPVNMIEAE